LSISGILYPNMLLQQTRSTASRDVSTSFVHPCDLVLMSTNSELRSVNRPSAYIRLLSDDDDDDDDEMRVQAKPSMSISSTLDK